MKKLVLVAPVLIMVVVLTLLHQIGIISDSAVEKVFARFENI